MRIKLRSHELGYNGNNIELVIQPSADDGTQGTLVLKRNRVELWTPHARAATTQITWAKLMDLMLSETE